MQRRLGRLGLLKDCRRSKVDRDIEERGKGERLLMGERGEGLGKKDCWSARDFVEGDRRFETWKDLVARRGSGRFLMIFLLHLPVFEISSVMVMWEGRKNERRTCLKLWT